MKSLAVFLIVFLVLSVVSLIYIFVSIISGKLKNNKILAEYFESKVQNFKVIKNKSTKKITDILFSSNYDAK